MAVATLKCLKCCGTNAANETDCSKNPLFLSGDTSSASKTTYPVAVPRTAGANYSYELWIRYELDTPPDSYLQNFKIYGPDTRPDESGAQKLSIYLGTTDSGVTPTDSQSSIATLRADINYYSPGTACDMGVTPGDGKLEASGEKTNYIVMQLKVEQGAQSGSMTTQAFTLLYDEV